MGDAMRPLVLVVLLACALGQVSAMTYKVSGLDTLHAQAEVGVRSSVFNEYCANCDHFTIVDEDFVDVESLAMDQPVFLEVHSEVLKGEKKDNSTQGQGGAGSGAPAGGKPGNNTKKGDTIALDPYAPTLKCECEFQPVNTAKYPPKKTAPPAKPTKTEPPIIPNPTRAPETPAQTQAAGGGQKVTPIVPKKAASQAQFRQKFDYNDPEATDSTHSTRLMQYDPDQAALGNVA